MKIEQLYSTTARGMWKYPWLCNTEIDKCRRKKWNYRL